MWCETGEDKIGSVPYILSLFLLPQPINVGWRIVPKSKETFTEILKFHHSNHSLFLTLCPMLFSLCHAWSIPKLEQKYLVPQILFIWNDLTWPEAKSFQSCVLLWLVLTWMLLRVLSAWANHWMLFFFASHKWNIDLPEITEKEEKIYF